MSKPKMVLVRVSLLRKAMRLIEKQQALLNKLAGLPDRLAKAKG